ncbi:carbohydrate ABC transporter permease [Lachnoclostridium sp. Marseille-P6806]|uniref:carbohydrate ABC transporter permease n=1 Tax=Lachnoclostridium sp. Marseille-P6806 TaxID=2364793 RepID=UPI001F5FDD97|nr:carbohydrate ABC transporter permease [Lachnoclostridium sp. Marseille-P6806]
MSAVRIKSSPQEALLRVVNIGLLCLITLLCTYPFYYVVIGSVSSGDALADGVFLLPRQITFYTYNRVFAKGDIGHAFLVSAARVVSGTSVCLLCSSFFAYLMTKREMVGRRIVYRIVISTMYIHAGLIPWYLTMKMYGLKNHFLLYILPGAVSAYYIILMKTFIEQLPASMEESAALDGAGIFRTFWYIILPLSKPIIATIAVYCAVGQWNAWADNYFLVTDPRLQTVQLILYNYLRQAEQLASSMRSGMLGNSVLENAISPTGVRMAITVITVIPIMCVYPFLQKYFAKGIMMGAVKG